MWYIYTAIVLGIVSHTEFYLALMVAYPSQESQDLAFVSLHKCYSRLPWIYTWQPWVSSCHRALTNFFLSRVCHIHSLAEGEHSLHREPTLNFTLKSLPFPIFLSAAYLILPSVISLWLFSDTWNYIIYLSSYFILPTFHKNLALVYFG